MRIFPIRLKKDVGKVMKEQGERLQKLHVDGCNLKNEKGEIVQLRGISSHGIGWYPEYINGDCLKQLKTEFHANVIRLAMYTDEDAGYCTLGNHKQQMDVIRRGVTYAEECGMYVIIDWHILADNDPTIHETDAVRFFETMSHEMKDRTNVLYEICNEPNGDVSWKTVKEYAKRIISVIRKEDKDAVIIVGTPEWSQRVDQACADPVSYQECNQSSDPVEAHNIMYTLHFYAASHKDQLRNRMINAINNGLPVFVSEFGICEASGNGFMDYDEAQRWIDVMDEYHISYLAWNLSNKEESSAILRPDCKKTSDFTEDDLTESGKWVKKMLTEHINY